MTWRCGCGPSRQLRERDGDRILEIVGQPAETRPEHDPDLGHDIRPPAHPVDERRDPFGLIDRRDRATWVDGVDVGDGHGLPRATGARRPA